MALARPGLFLDEVYYSQHVAGAVLGMHMDERHEETKGECAWSSETRRSVSWILYLNAPDWDDDDDSDTDSDTDDALDDDDSRQGRGGALSA